jgi:uncharacterized protein
MAEIDHLVELQDLDLAVDNVSQRLIEVEGLLGESDQVIEAHQALGDLREQLHVLEGNLKQREWDVSDLDSRISALDTKLYGGTVRNPRELSDLQREADHMRANKRNAEDVMLRLMGEIEDLTEQVTRAQHELVRLTTVWEAEQKELAARQNELKSEVTMLTDTRKKVAGRISPAALSTYENLRRSRRGRAVARVERSTCQGCRTNLSLSELQRARHTQQLAFCGSCGRILYLPR